MATASLKGDASLGFFLYFFLVTRANNYWMALFLKGKFLFKKNLGGVGWGAGNCYCATVKGTALLECVVHTHVCFCVLVAFCCCFLLLWDSHA